MYNNYPVMREYPSNNYPAYNNYSNNGPYYQEDDRFLLAPFLLGGLAGTALGYGVANSNNNPIGYYPVYPMYPIYPQYNTYPTYSSTNYYY